MTGFVRFQAPESSDEGVRPGVFWLVNRLGRDGRLSAEDERLRRESNAWFDAAYTTPTTVNPTLYSDNPLAVAWFKESATPLIEATERHCRLLDRYDVAWERVHSSDPGRVVYEDDEQVVVVPHSEPTGPATSST